MTKNYYTILEISPHASQEEIHLAYEKALTKVRSHQSKEAIVEVEEAYFILSDPDARLHYDNVYKISADLLNNFDGLDSSKMANSINSLNSEVNDFDEPEFLGDLLETVQDIFSEIVSLPGAKRRTEKSFSDKSDICLDFKVSPQEAFLGGYKEIEYQSYIKCSDCGGLGSQNTSELVPCLVCAGVTKNFNNKNNCLVCAGLGKYPGKNCLKCKGQGRVMAIKKAEVLIPSKVKNNTVLKVAKQGHYGFRSLPTGDLTLRVVVKP